MPWSTSRKHLKSLDTASDDTRSTPLTRCLSDKSTLGWIGRFYQAIALAARSLNELGWLEHTYATAIDVAKRQRKSAVAFALQVSLADLFISYDNKEDRAIEIWQMVMDFPATFMQGNFSMLYLQSLVSRVYGTYLLSKAIQAGPGTTDAQCYIRTLEQIAKRRVVHMEHISESAANNFAMAILGLWYHRIGQQEKAREFLLPFARQFVSSDTDGLSAYLACYIFAMILLVIGDDSTAVAILHNAVYLKTTWGCEARCGLEPTNWTNANICRDCAVSLCGDFLRLVKERQPMRVNICSPDHSWVHIPDPSVTTGPDDVCSDDQVPIHDLKNRIKKQWGL